MENEKYYDDLLLYIRLQMKLSEQQTEEVLMEMLDHLIEGQNEGKTAREIFGDNPQKYADEIVGELPPAKVKKIIPFVSYLTFNLISLLLLINGVTIFVASFFKNVDSTVFPFNSLIQFLVLLTSIGFEIEFIFYLIRKSLFRKHSSKIKDSVAVGISVVLFFSLNIGLPHLIPNFGPSFQFGWIPSIITGVILWLICFWAKKRFKII